MFEGFISRDVKASGTAIHVTTGGSGPPLLLLHGYPQSHVMWHKVAPQLARDFSLVLPDLRGYGESDKPKGTADHANYSKRVMAQDMADVMQALGFGQYAVSAHDRGGRVAHRLAVDHPHLVSKLMLMDISPTLAMYEQTNMEFARAYWWWFFLIQPAPFPETLICAQPEVYLQKKIGYGTAGLTPFTDEAYAAYLRHVSDAATVHGMCEDYRAAASIDLEHDRADRYAGRRIQCPLHVIWGEHGVMQRCFKPLEDWRKVTDERFAVSGHHVPSGHYIAEEIPERTIGEITQFFNA